MTRRSGRTLALLLALLLGAGSAAGRLLADEAPAPGAPAKEVAKEAVEAAAPKDRAPLDAYLEQMTGSPASVWALLLVYAGGGLVGLVLLVRLWLRLDARRGAVLTGAAPPPAPTPAPTTPYPVGTAVLLFLLSMVATYVVLMVLSGLTGVSTERLLDKLPLALAVQTAVGLPFVALVAVRRARLAPSRPGLPRAAGIGVWTWFVALALVVPASVVSLLLLRALGETSAPQELVRIAVDSATPGWLPWVILGYGVVFAPLIEETIFRGMLYPGIRSALGGGRRGVWGAALVTALLFAAIHAHVPSLVPLFVLATVLALVFEKTDSLAGVTVAHGLFNLGSLVPVLLARYS